MYKTYPNQIIRLTLERVRNVCNNCRLQQLTKLFISHECIGIWKYLKNIFTPHVTGSVAMPSFCRSELPLCTYHPIKTLSF